MSGYAHPHAESGPRSPLDRVLLHLVASATDDAISRWARRLLEDGEAVASPLESPPVVSVAVASATLR